MKIDAELLTLDGWTLRQRLPSGPGASRAVLMLHGWKGDENAMWIFARKFPPDVAVLAPRAPHPAPGGGYSWREADPATRGWPTLESLRPAADALIALLDRWGATTGVDTARVDVVGFSQGGAMACALAWLHPRRLRRMAVLAGFVPLGVEALGRALEGLPVFVAHGTQDDLVPIARARESMAALEKAGALVSTCEAPVGHRVSADCLRGLEDFLFGDRS